MSRATAIVLALATLVPAVVASSAGYRLEDRRTVGDAQPYRLQKILVVGISDDRNVRHRFEDKFASHFTSRDLASKASYTIVPSLTEVGDRDRILAAIQKEGVDSVMTVRAVGLDAIGDQGWTQGWEAWLGKDPTIRGLIDASLPWPKKRAKRYGIEFALWQTQPARLLWTSRTGSVARKDLEDGVGDLLQLAIDGLKDAHWL